jgi:plasmid stabilization system protein ParE
MTFIFHPDALAEYADAALYYSDRVPGLGADFVKEVETGIASVIHAPEQSPLVEEDVRRFLVRRFPYGLLYILESDHVLIVAVMHLSREPGYWRHRLQ